MGRFEWKTFCVSLLNAAAYSCFIICQQHIPFLAFFSFLEIFLTNLLAVFLRGRNVGFFGEQDELEEARVPELDPGGPLEALQHLLNEGRLVHVGHDASEGD